MAKVSTIKKNNKRKKNVQRLAPKRAELKSKIYDKSISLEERFELVMKLSKLPRNSSKVRIRNRCAITGRPRGFYRKFGLSRHMLRFFAVRGELPGVIKSSW
ncbi:MAG: 30S ribosomal protein S14 [Rickettsiaceae bacterium]